MPETIISPLASVHSGATIGNGVRIDPFVVIEDDVEIGDGTWVQAHAHLRSGARIGKDCQIFTGASIGAVPQDLKFSGEPTLAIVGDRTVVREYVTIHRGTLSSNRTVVGTDCLLMAYCHVAHDCKVGDNVILANTVQLGGHVHIDDWAIVGGVTGIHQFERIGKHAMVGACVKVAKDVPPYALAGKEPLSYSGINAVGLRRRGFTPETIHAIGEAYRMIYRAGLPIREGATRAAEEFGQFPEVQEIVEFINTSQRGIIPYAR